MPRYGSLCIPDFPVVALRRAEPELRGVSLLLTRSGQRPQSESRILSCSSEAIGRGAMVGMTVGQAMVRSSDFLVRPVDPEVIEAARKAFFETVFTLLAHVELPELSRDSAQFLHLEVPSSGGRFRNPGGLAAALLSRLAPGGFFPGVGVADRLATARAAAQEASRRPGEVVLVTPGEDRAWLAQRPLQVLQPDSDTEVWLQSIGIQSCGELAAIPRDPVATRLGQEGVRLWEKACGVFAHSLQRTFPGVDLLEGVSLEWSVDSLEALVLVLRGLLQRLLDRLELRARAVSAMRLRLEMVDGVVQERSLSLLAPTRESRVLLEALRLELERRPPPAALAKVALVFVPGDARPEQLDLFRPAGPAPLRLATTLARLASICGGDRVGRPLSPQGYRPEVVGMAPFVPVAGKSMAQEACGAPAPRTAPITLLRLLRPALRIEVQREGAVFSKIVRNGVSAEILRSGGPWRIEVEWWAESPCCRDYYDLELSRGGFCRIYQDLNVSEHAAAWFLAGIYD